MKCKDCNEVLEPGSLLDYMAAGMPYLSRWHPGVPDRARLPFTQPARKVDKGLLVEVMAFRCPRCFTLTLRAAPPSTLPQPADEPADTDTLPRGTAGDEG